MAIIHAVPAVRQLSSGRYPRQDEGCHRPWLWSCAWSASTNSSHQGGNLKWFQPSGGRPALLDDERPRLSFLAVRSRYCSTIVTSSKPKLRQFAN